MRIAITHPYSWPDVRRGAERMIVETARCVAARGHEVTVYTTGRPGVPGVRCVSLLPVRRDPFLHEMLFGAQVAPRLLAGRYDAVHCMMPFDAAAAVATAARGGHRVVYEELGIPDPEFWASRRDGRVRRWLVDRVDVYGCMSPYAADALAARFGRQATVIPGGVRLDQFRPGRRAERPTVLFSGALTEPRKGLAVLLGAVGLLLGERPDLQLWLSGPGDVSPLLRAASREVRDCVEVLPLGAPEGQAERYAEAWVTALPSTWDSFGLVLVESLAAGTPIVVADHAAPPSLVTPSTGAVAAPDDAGALAAALRRGLDLAADPATAGRCRDYAARFDWDGAIAPLLEDLYGRTAPVDVPT